MIKGGTGHALLAHWQCRKKKTSNRKGKEAKKGKSSCCLHILLYLCDAAALLESSHALILLTFSFFSFFHLFSCLLRFICGCFFPNAPPLLTQRHACCLCIFFFFDLKNKRPFLWTTQPRHVDIGMLLRNEPCTAVCLFFSLLLFVVVKAILSSV